MKFDKNLGGSGSIGKTNSSPPGGFSPPLSSPGTANGKGHQKDGPDGHKPGHDGKGGPACDAHFGDSWNGKEACLLKPGKDWNGKDWTDAFKPGKDYNGKDWHKGCDDDHDDDDDDDDCGCGGDDGCTPPPAADTDILAPGGNFAGTALDEVIRGAAGVAHVIAGRDGADVVIGAELGDFLLGNGGDDTLYGLDGNDTLFGGVANDILCGGKGADRLDGDQGSDTLTGGAGADVFEFNGNKADGGIDTITDFNAAEDSIEVVNSTGLSTTTVQQGDDVLLTISDASGTVLHQAVILDALLAEVNAHLTLV